MDGRHTPAMPAEVLAYLNVKPGKTVVDGTLGRCGHALQICENISPTGTLIGIDQDIAAVEYARQRLHECSLNVHLVHDNFSNLPSILAGLKIPAVDGILLDLGISLHQIEAGGRGFSFKGDEPLDMRMDIKMKSTAADLLNRESERSLTDIFRDFGEERWARKIARKVVFERKKKPVQTSRQLVDIITAAVPGSALYKQKIHPATRIFMALRIAVNRELEMLDTFLNHALACLNPSGRLCILSFHSLEDRMVKHRFRDLEKGCSCPPQLPQCVCGGKPAARVLTRRVVRPEAEEIARNPMARSTRLRALEKL